MPFKSMSLGRCGQRRHRTVCTLAWADQGLHCLLTESLDTTECMNGKQTPGPSCSKLTMSLVNVLLKL